MRREQESEFPEVPHSKERESKTWVLGPGSEHLQQVMKPRRATVSHWLNKDISTYFSVCLLESNEMIQGL